MQYRKNIVLQFTIISFVLTLMASLVLANAVSRHVADNLIQTHISVFPDFVRNDLTHHQEVLPWFSQAPDGSTSGAVKDFFDSLLAIQGVFRIKVWNTEGTILWSDLPELIGQNFVENPLFRQAVSGQVAYSKKPAQKAENVGEKDSPVILEIYTPVVQGNKVIGVVELYETDTILLNELGRAKWLVWSRTLAIGAILYVCLVAFFWHAHNRYRRRTLELIETQDVTIHALAYQSEIHDIETGSHLERTTRYVKILAEELSRADRDRKTLTKDYKKDLVKSAPLHDIGKVGVADYILHKPGKLTDDEFDQMKKHCEYGTSILRRAEAKLSFASFLQVAIDITQCHHEKWDGSGYPSNLSGEDIPLAARIMAVADVYDALRSKRYYKKPIPHEECLKIMAEDRGVGFDPLVVDAMFKHQQEFLEVSRTFSD